MSSCTSLDPEERLRAYIAHYSSRTKVVPDNVVEEIAKPLTLLFVSSGIFAGGLCSCSSRLPRSSSAIPISTGWNGFDASSSACAGFHLHPAHILYFQSASRRALRLSGPALFVQTQEKPMQQLQTHDMRSAPRVHSSGWSRPRGAIGLPSGTPRRQPDHRRIAASRASPL